MRKHGVTQSMLPEGSAIINKTYSYYEQHRQIIWFSGIIGSVLLILLFVFIHYSQLKRMSEKKLIESESQYRSLYENMLEGFVILDNRGFFLESNQAFRDLVGYTEEELRDLRYWDLTPVEWYKEQEFYDKQLQSQGYTDLYEKEYFHKDGGRVQLEFRTYLTYKDSVATGRWAVIRNITQRKEHEKRIKEYVGQIEEKNAELSATMEEMEALNEELIASQNILLEHDKKITSLNEELEERVLERTRELQNTINDLQITQKQLIEFEKMASLGELVAGIAHEINTPIGVGITAASFLDEQSELLRENYNNDTLPQSKLIEYISVAKDSSGMILRNLKRAGELVQNFKQVSVDQSDEHLRFFNVQDYISDILYSLKSTLRKAGHSVVFECQEAIEIKSYPGVFFQIITNLIMNSIAHGFDPGTEGTISIRCSLEEDTVLIRYSDDGKGMSEEVLAKIFEPFYTTKRSAGGTGLGMHIVYNLVMQRLKGTITCSSTMGQGVEFFIRFPRYLD